MMSTRPAFGPFPWRFILLVVVVSIPFWLAGAAPNDVLPGIPLIDLPISALVAFAPLIAALLLVSQDEGVSGAKRLLQRAVDYRRITNPLWYVPVIFLSAIGEEVGWTGYATDPLLDRWRALIVWLFINTEKSLFAAVLFHTVVNVSEFAFPVFGSHYDPFMFTILVALTIVIVVAVWDVTLGGRREMGSLTL